MKITGTSSYIKIEINGKAVKIQGEMIVNGFVAYKNTIENWEQPYDNIKIDDITKQNIINAVINEYKNSNFKILFE